MKFVVHATDAARLDAAEAAGWYEDREPGLGLGFRLEVARVLRSLSDAALHHPIRFRDVRRAGLRRFSPYGLFYIVRGDQVTVFAVSHAAKNPSWLRRRRSHLD